MLKWNINTHPHFWPSVSLSPLNYQARHFLSSSWPHFPAVNSPVNRSISWINLHTPAAHSGCLSLSWSTRRKAFLWFLLPLPLPVELSLAFHSLCYILLVLQQTHASCLLSPCAAGNVISLFSLNSFVLPFFSRYYLTQSHSCDHSLSDNNSSERGYFPTLFPPLSHPPPLAF